MSVWAAVSLVIASACGAAADHWAVLVAGSNGLANYRHQADVCHANNVLLDRGVPADHIITMTADDVASSSLNPVRGKLFNAPAPKGKAGKDVYKRCQKDYTGDNVSTAKFLAVLTGDAKAAGGKVLKSTKNDDVFVFFADHGAPGLVMVCADELHAAQLQSALATMHARGLYGRLVFYMEACNSGSMFDGLLPPNISVYAATAAKPDEESWATYCNEKVGNADFSDICLGDQFSVAFLENVESSLASTETLDQQFAVVVQKTPSSHVMRYGDINGFKPLAVLQFFGNQSSKLAQSEAPLAADTASDSSPSAARSAVSPYDVQLYFLQRKHERLLAARAAAASAASERAPDEELARAARELGAEQAHRALVERAADQLVRFAAGQHVAALSRRASQVFAAADPRLQCYRAMVKRFRLRCGYDDYPPKFFYVLNNMCADLTSTPLDELLAAVDTACAA